MTLTLEHKDQQDTSEVAPGLMMTPAIDEEYWLFRVRLSDKQAILGFPKFGTIGIGFALEEDWNTNLPYSCTALEIYEHILHNKGDDSISNDDVLTAITMVKQAATQLKGEREP